MNRIATLIGLSALALTAVIAAGCATEDDAQDPESFEVTADDQMEDTVFEQMSMDGKADGTLTYQAVARLAKNAGISCTGSRIALATAVAKAESGFRSGVSNVVGNSHGVDRGLWQVNSYWHPEISAACAFSPSCNARAMASISSHGTKWSPWWTYVNGKHLPFMSQARAAQTAVCE